MFVCVKFKVSETLQCLLSHHPVVFLTIYNSYLKVKDRSSFIIREMRIADRTVENLEVTVVNSQKYDWVMGQKTLKSFGAFEFNTDEHKLIFK